MWLLPCTAVENPVSSYSATPGTQRGHKGVLVRSTPQCSVHIPMFPCRRKSDVAQAAKTHNKRALAQNTNDAMQVSYILYLVDKDWGSGEKPDGGGLQLYPLENEEVPGVPAYAPSKTIPPRWNQMVLFAVQPGRSFHDVQEVLLP